ncbi:MAG: sulfate permease [Verrucomicrobia bacterium]|nr:sulfate permease [Verrucomicrobiota bacterium]
MSEFTPKSWSLLRQGYTLGLFKNDLLAGITVGIVALPLAMAFAIASGVSPEKGLYTAIVAGFLISLLGGSRCQIGGPTGAFVVIIYAIIQKSGYEGLAIVTLIAAALLLIAAFSRLGSLIKFIPYPLVTGFTTGIAVIIFSSQIKDFFGLKIPNLPADFIPKWLAIFAALPTLDATTFGLALGSLIAIILIKRFIPVLPWGITAVVLATLVSYFFELPVDTIASRFGEIKRSFPLPSIPSFAGINLDWKNLIPDAITVAFLAGIESLLSAVVADGMSGSRHRSNCELMAQGFANVGSILFGGIPATGAIARTATNIKSGAKTPVAGMIHALTLLLIIFAFAPLVSQIPLAALAAVLIMVAWNMSELEHFVHLFKAPLGDRVVLLSTFLLTVFVDLTTGVEVGMILAVFLFVKRMGDMPGVISLAFEKETTSEKYDLEAMEQKKLPRGVEVYEITGPFFFGVADSLKNVLSNIERPPKVFILRMRKVPIIDASGMTALSEFYDKCHKEGTILLITEMSDDLQGPLKKFGLIERIGTENIFSHIDQALERSSRINKPIL